MDIAVNGGELVPGLLPAVCLKTGQPAQTTRKAVFRYTPVWIYLLLPAGLLIAAILAEALSTKVEVQFPVSRSVVRDHRRRVAIAVAVIVGTPVLFGALAAWTGLQILAAPAIAGVLVGLLILIRAQCWIQGKLDKHGIVNLRKVSPEWVAQRQALVNHYRAAQQYAAQQYQYAAQQYAAQQQIPATTPYAAQPYGYQYRSQA